MQHGPQHSTETRIDRVFSFGKTKTIEVLEMFGFETIDEFKAFAESLTKLEQERFDRQLGWLADAGLMGIQSQESEYVGSGMVEDYYLSRSWVVRFDRDEMIFKSTNQTNDWEPSVFELRIPWSAQRPLLDSLNYSSSREMFADFDRGSWEAWSALELKCREVIA